MSLLLIGSEVAKKSANLTDVCLHRVNKKANEKENGPKKARGVGCCTQRWD